MPLVETPSTLQLNSGDLRNILRAIKAFAVDEGFFCPTGAILPYGASTAPTGWLLCDGTAYSRTTYERLFDVVSTNFGSGDGSTTFNVPDLRGRLGIALDNLGGTSANRITATWADSLGGTGGHELLQAHTHTFKAETRTPTAGAGVNVFGVDNITTEYTDRVLSTGGGNAENIQPSMALGYIIKT